MTEETTTNIADTTSSLVQEFGPSIYIANGPVVHLAGFPFPTRMVLVKLTNGSTWVWSPISLTPQLKQELEGLKLLDNVQHVVSPNKIHHLFLHEWQQAFPEAKFYASPGLADRKVVKDKVRFDAELSNESKTDYQDEISQVIFEGSFFMEEVVFYHELSKTAIFCDLIQRFPEEDLTGWKGSFAKLNGLVGKETSTPRDLQFTFQFGGKSKACVAKAVVVNEWKPENLIIAHGENVSDGTATDIINKAFSWV